jgi:hypothetical protein
MSNQRDIKERLALVKRDILAIKLAIIGSSVAVILAAAALYSLESRSRGSGIQGPHTQTHVKPSSSGSWFQIAPQ